jgi:hypothetical protein
MRALAAFHLAGGGFGQAQEFIRDRTGVQIGHAQLAGIARGLAAWTDDFYEERSRDAEEEEQPASDVIMMQGDGKGIAMRPEHRRNAGKDDGTRPGIKKMAEIVAVADFTPAVREPEDIAAPPARRTAHPGPEARDKWVSASVTESIEDMIAAALGDADRRDPERSGSGSSTPTGTSSISPPSRPRQKNAASKCRSSSTTSTSLNYPWFQLVRAMFPQVMALLRLM